jgi:hypothetical protein
VHLDEESDRFVFVVAAFVKPIGGSHVSVAETILTEQWLRSGEEMTSLSRALKSRLGRGFIDLHLHVIPIDHSGASGD